ncbi:hypothetical protein SAMN04488037_11095 [Shimia marina]|uniref:Uncharacterized protein n=1 Tax=Shimia marina TaxID=321267 RepID=A0A0N7LS45_9RHOB|nr:hypothetical protein SHM7688_02043 [Shimia marina]SFE51119.1 hypothetical protein SAMN04488037_11095 [Shimia marina]
MVVYGVQGGLGLALARRYARHMMPQDALVLIVRPSESFAETIAEVRDLARCRVFGVAACAGASEWRVRQCAGLAQAAVVPCCLVVPVVAEEELPEDVAALVRQLRVPQVALIGEALTARRMAAKLRRQVAAQAVSIRAFCAEACATTNAAQLPSFSKNNARAGLADVVAMMSSPHGRQLWQSNLVARC